MKKAIRYVLLIALVLSSNSTLGQTLRSAAEPDYPPLSIAHTNGSADGFSVAMLKATLSEIGMEASFKTGPWNQIKTELAEGKLDVLPLVGRTPEREALYDFTIPYLTLHGALFVREDESHIQSLADLPGKRIAVMKGDNAEEYVLRAKLSDQIIRTTSFEDAFRMLAAGEADAVIAQKLMGVSLLKEIGIKNVKVVGRPNEEFKQDFCFAVQIGNRDLLAHLNEGLALVIGQGVQRRLMHQWLAENQTATAQARVLIYGDGLALPPFSFLDEQGRPSGFHADLLRNIAAKAGFDVFFQLEPLNEVRRAMKAGELDISSMFYTPERDQKMDFSLPFSEGYAAVFARDVTLSNTTLDDLKGQRVSVEANSVLHEIALRHGLEESLTLTATPQKALALLADEHVDFALTHHIPGLYWIRENNWENIRIANPHLMKTEMCFAVQEGNSELAALLNDGLQELRETGEYQRIYSKWLGEVDPYKDGIAEWFWPVLTCVVFVALLLFTANRLLRKKVHERTAELRASENRLKLATQSGGIGIWDLNLVDNVLTWDDRMFELYGINTEDFAGAYEAWQQGVHPDDLMRASAEVAAAQRGEKSFGTEFRIVRPDGVTRHIRAFAEVLRDENGTATRMIGTNQDVTEHRHAIEKVKESEVRLRGVVENSTNLFYSHTADHVLTYLSPRVKDILGYEVEEALTRWTTMATDNPANKRGFELTEKAIRTGQALPTYELELRHKDGHPVWVEVREAPVVENGNTVAIVGSLTDISPRKAAVEEMRARNRELERFNKASVGRELRMGELKKEVNALSHQLGQEEPYALFSSNGTYTGDADETT